MEFIPFFLDTGSPNILKKEWIDEFFSKNKQLQQYATINLELRLLEMGLFESLVTWILAQQISTKVADNLIRKFRSAVGSINPYTVQQLSYDQMRELGFSNNKIEYIQGLADTAINEGLPSLQGMRTPEAIKILTSYRGIGNWTAEMHLMFVDGRMDVFSPLDLVVRKGLQVLYDLPAVPTIAEAKAIGQAWQGCKTIGTLLAWEVAGG